jgi:ribose transport system ATP-binding protein
VDGRRIEHVRAIRGELRGSIGDQMDELLQIRGLTKAFGATQALKDVAFDLIAGETHALLGENGAGKSTCVKILNGLVRPDSGTIRLGGQEYRPSSLADAQRVGISTAFQELSLIPDLTVAINLAMPNIPRNKFLFVRFGELRRRAEEVLARYNISDISPNMMVSSLSLANKQRLEIIRALSRNPKVLILDEPTAALTNVEWLYEQISALTARGGAVIFITHRLKEVREVCQRATVLRNGEVAGMVVLQEISDSELFRLMIGRSMGTTFPKRPMRVRAAAEPVLAVEDLRSEKFGPVSFCVGAGEVLGVAALEGQGQRELFIALVGISGNSRGVVRINGREVKIRSPLAAKNAGLSFVPEERKEEGLFFGIPTRSNISISNPGRVGVWGIVWRKREIGLIGGVSAAIDLHSRYYDLAIDELSGGNQQKALIARSLFADSKCLLMFDPTRGVDVGTKQSIYAVIRSCADSGMGVLLYSTELLELTGLCDRCIVLYGNRIVGECQAESLTEENLIQRMHDAQPRVAEQEISIGQEQRASSR